MLIWFGNVGSSATMMQQDQMYPQEFTTLVDLEVRRLKKKQAWTTAKKFNKGHHWNKFRKVRNYLHKLLSFKYN